MGSEMCIRDRVNTVREPSARVPNTENRKPHTVPCKLYSSPFQTNKMDTPSRTHRILIADDNEANRELLEAYLAAMDCEIDYAVDGQETIEKAKSFQPDLILLDIMMPKLSGFEVCEQIKGDAELKHIMILMVTALDELGDVERAVDAGTNDFLSKPVNRLTLQKRVENMLALKGMSDENERLRQYIQQVEDAR